MCAGAEGPTPPTIRAGTPATVVLAGTERKTTDPAATLAQAPMVIVAAGDISNTVAAYQLLLGGANNGGEPGSFGSGFRTINWDGVPDDQSAPTPYDPNFFNAPTAPRARGAVFSTPGTNLFVSADSDNPTNTLPRWPLAHPFRMLAHNGEINTIEGNRRWAQARGKVWKTPKFDVAELEPIVSMHGSDSQSLDNMLELLVSGGMELIQALRILVPPATQSLEFKDPDLAAFYEFYGLNTEPWDGPAGIVSLDSRYAVCTLDRNGLRPSRWLLTSDRHFIVASEAGVWEVPTERIVRKGKLGPGEMIAIDLRRGDLLDSEAIHFDVTGSKSFGLLQPYGALGVDTFKMDALYEDANNPGSRISVAFDRETHFHFTAGLLANFKVVQLHGEVNFAAKNGLAVGLSFGK